MEHFSDKITFPYLILERQISNIKCPGPACALTMVVQFKCLLNAILKFQGIKKYLNISLNLVLTLKVYPEF